MYRVIYKDYMSEMVIFNEKNVEVNNLPHLSDYIKINDKFYQIKKRVRFPEESMYLLIVKKVK